MHFLTHSKRSEVILKLVCLFVTEETLYIIDADELWRTTALIHVDNGHSITADSRQGS